MDYLEAQGFVLGRDWCWRHPENREATEKEADAIIYLIEEWDFGGYDRKKD